MTFICSFFSRYFSSEKRLSDNPVPINPNLLLVAATMICLVLVSGLRNSIGDTYYYMHAYTVTTFTFEEVMNQKDIGFGLLQVLLQKISDDPQILIFTTALITNVLIVLVLRQYSRQLELSVFVFIASGLFLVSMNGIRQFLAAAIIFAAMSYILNGNWKKFFLIVIIASLFHQSALILLPVYFIVRQKAWTRTTILLLIVAVFIVIGFDEFLSFVFSIMGDSQYSNYQTFDEGGANFLRIAVYAAPLVLAFIGKEKLRDIFPKSDIIVNLSLLNVIFMIIATQNWIFARFTIYFGLYHLILIGWIVKLFREKDQKLLYLVILACYTIYFYYEHVISLNIIYRSYYL